MNRARRPSPDHSLLAVLLVGLAFVTVSLTSAPDARADIVVAVDGDYAIPVGEWLEKPGGGVGVQGRVGYTLPLPLVELGIEALGRYQTFPSDDGSADFDYWQVGGGLRAGLPLAIEPVAFVHLGYGELEGLGSDYVIFDHGLVVDVGLALDYTALPFVSLGAHVAYFKLFDSDDPNPSLPSESQWVATGLHVALSL